MISKSFSRCNLLNEKGQKSKDEKAGRKQKVGHFYTYEVTGPNRSSGRVAVTIPHHNFFILH